MALEILHRDQWLVVVDKPAGMLVHRGRDPEPKEQIAMKVLRDLIGHRVQSVHRLDRPTSGVLLFALDEKIEAALRRQFEQQTVKKTYRAIVAGNSAMKWESCETLQKLPGEPFRPALTRFEKMETAAIGGETFSILRVFPETGRHHQIRKHLAMSGSPIVGDYLYGSVEEMDRLSQITGQTRLMLHAEELAFVHPVEGLEMSIRSRLPDRFEPFLSASR